MHKIFISSAYSLTKSFVSHKKKNEKDIITYAVLSSANAAINFTLSTLLSDSKEI